MLAPLLRRWKRHYSYAKARASIAERFYVIGISYYIKKPDKHKQASQPTILSSLLFHKRIAPPPMNIHTIAVTVSTSNCFKIHCFWKISIWRTNEPCESLCDWADGSLLTIGHIHTKTHRATNDMSKNTKCSANSIVGMASSSINFQVSCAITKTFLQNHQFHILQ